MAAERNIQEQFNDLLGFMQSQGFKGYDPYDGANTSFKLLKFHKYSRLFLVYFNKFWPFNFRPLFGIKKRKNPQAMALVARALMNVDPQLEQHKALVEECLDFILSKSLIDKKGYHCWNGNDMYVQTLKEYQTPFDPGAVGTTECGWAFLNYYRLFPTEKHKEVLLSIQDFFVKELKTEYKGYTFIKYKPITKNHDYCFNASILATALIAAIDAEFAPGKNDELVKKSIEGFLSFQKEDGRWNYTVNLNTGAEKPQIDFHQGFVLDAMLELSELGYGTVLEGPYKKGLEFYQDVQFLPNGMSYYRYPKKNPANIHNQAQGIISFTKAHEKEGNFLEIALKILEFTNSKMKNKRKGWYAYLHYPALTYWIPYMRWNQAWMLLALSHLIKSGAK